MENESDIQNEDVQEVDDLSKVDDELSSPDSLEEYINELNRFIDESNELGDEMRKLILDSKLSKEDELNKSNLFSKLDRVGQEFSHNVDKLDPEGVLQSVAKQNTDLILHKKVQEESQKDVTTYDEDGYFNPQDDDEEEEEYDEEEIEDEEEIVPLGDELKEIINSDKSIKDKILDAYKTIIQYLKYWIEEKKDEDDSKKGFSWPYIKKLLKDFIKGVIKYSNLLGGYLKKLFIYVKDYVTKLTKKQIKKEELKELPKQSDQEIENKEENMKEKVEERERGDEDEIEEQIEPEQESEERMGPKKDEEVSTKKAKRSVKERIRRIQKVRGAAEFVVINNMPVRIGLEGEYSYKPVSDYEKECFKKNPYFKRGADELQKVFNQEISIEMAKHFIRKDKSAKKGLVKSVDVIFSSTEHAYILQAREKDKLRCVKIAEDRWLGFNFENEYEGKPKKMKEVLKIGKGNLEKVTKTLDYYNIGLKNMLFILKDVEITTKKNIKILGKDADSKQKSNIERLLERVDGMSVGFMKGRSYEKNKIRVIDDYCYKIQK